MQTMHNLVKYSLFNSQHGNLALKPSLIFYFHFTVISLYSFVLCVQHTAEDSAASIVLFEWDGFCWMMNYREKSERHTDSQVPSHLESLMAFIFSTSSCRWHLVPSLKHTNVRSAPSTSVFHDGLIAFHPGSCRWLLTVWLRALTDKLRGLRSFHLPLPSCPLICL